MGASSDEQRHLRQRDDPHLQRRDVEGVRVRTFKTEGQRDVVHVRMLVRDGSLSARMAKIIVRK